MRYKSFRIQHFKGIKDTIINLNTIGGAAVFALVGLNESGKTTVLEAIHSFAADAATSELLGGDEGDALGVPFKDRVPRHQISSFTGQVSVTAKLSVTDHDKAEIARVLRSSHLLLDTESFPSEVEIQRYQSFENGDFKQSVLTLRTPVNVRGLKQQKWRIPKDREERTKVRDAIFRLVPSIAYFPTFVFNFPETVFLTDRGSIVDQFYRRVFQDILDFDGRGHTIDKDIIRRVRSTDFVLPWLSFLAAWGQHDDRDKIQHVVDRASAAVTKLVFGRWNKIFGEDTKGKEIVISFEIAEGEEEDDSGTAVKTEEHDVLIKFQIRDGTRRFNVNDRSLGFRWFFAFMLFTQFRVARSVSRPLLFLFDEPASNLHAAAQQKLIDCFPEIAQKEHTLIYSTHSHYMIEPKWLEQTFIVTNRLDAPSSSVLDEISLDDESLDIQVEPYRSFANTHPNQTSYFQPILDRLEVVPSRFDILKPSVVLEGKSDYYILRYAAKVHKAKELPLIPGLGAGTFGALAALHSGWNLNFLFVLDGDDKGKQEKDRYETEFGIARERLVTIDELVAGITNIESLLDDEALESIRAELQLAMKPSKNHIRRFFQERLASEKVDKLSSGFMARSKALLKEIAKRLDH